MIIMQEDFDRICREFKSNKRPNIPSDLTSFVSVTSDAESLKFDSINFRDVKFDMAYYPSLVFVNCSFESIHFSNSIWYGAKFIGCMIDRCLFSNNEFHNCEFRSNRIVCSDFYGSQFNSTKIIGDNKIIHSKLTGTFNYTTFKTKEYGINDLHLLYSWLSFQFEGVVNIDGIHAQNSGISLHNCFDLKNVDLNLSEFEVEGHKDALRSILIQIKASHSTIDSIIGSKINPLSNVSCSVDTSVHGSLESFVDTIIRIDNIGSRDSYTDYHVKYNWVECGCWRSGNKELMPPTSHGGGLLEDFKERVLSVYPDESNKYHKQYMDAIAQFRKARKDYLESIEKEGSEETKKASIFVDDTYKGKIETSYDMSI